MKVLLQKIFQERIYKKCAATSAKYEEEEFKDLWESLGFSVDWSLQYETINPMVQRNIAKNHL